MHGIKKYFEGIEKVIDISSGENCGSHVNISLAKWNNTSEIYEYKVELFKPLVRAIAELSEGKRVEIFGRDFGSYRRYEEYDFEHGDWLQIKSKCLEFRISRYRNATQYSHLIMLYAEWVKIIDTVFLANPSYKTAEATAKKMIHLLKLHSEGKAKYQYQERNK